MTKHTHKYERRKLGSWKTKGHDIYKCTLPGCTHYMLDMEATVGRLSKCWGKITDWDNPIELGGVEFSGLKDCPNEVVLTRHLVFSEKRKHPLCDECKQKKKNKKSEELMEQKMSKIEQMLTEEGYYE